MVGVITASFVIVRGRVDNEKLDRIIELGKWFVLSVGLVLGATVISDGFRERAEDVKEIEVFDKHVATIIETDGIEKRWALAEYFSIVAPSGALRTAWGNYKSHIEKDVLEYKASKQKLIELKAKPETSEADRKLIAELQDRTKTLDESLRGSSSASEWLIIAGTDISMDQAQYELEKAQSISPSARVYKIRDQYRTTIRGFPTRADAEQMLPIVQKQVNSTAYILSLSSWCPTYVDRGEYLECQS